MKQKVKDSHIGFHDCELNSQSVNRLLGNYIRFGLIQGQRLQFLHPLFPLIRKTWQQALLGESPLLREVSHQNREKKQWASMSTWQTTENGIYGQAIVASPRNSIGTLHVMRNQLERLEGKHFQLWFEEGVRMNYKLFGPPTVAKLNQEAGMTLYDSRPFHYLLLDPSRFRSKDSRIRIVPYHRDYRDSFYSFVTSLRGEVYAQTEELSHPEISLDQLDETYQTTGLHRTRIVLLAFDAGDSYSPAGAAIVYRGPLGLNLSLMENKLDLMISRNVSKEKKIETLEALVYAARQYYFDFPTSRIPVTTEQPERDLLTLLDPNAPEKVYIRSAVLGGKYSQKALQHYRDLLEQKEKRFQKRLNRESVKGE